MKKLSIILAFILVAMISCTKSKEVHPEIGDGNDEIVTVGMKDVHVEYTRTDHAELNRVVFHYCPADANGNAQQFAAAEMTKKETFFELVLDDLICDTLYWYYYELFPNSGDAFNTVQKTFHTQACDTPEPPEPPTPPSGTPEGAINGLFTINENGDQVYFSQGNLQYQASTNIWRFAENQWDFVGSQNPFYGDSGGTVPGSDNNGISETYDGWIDLFGWGTSGWHDGSDPYNVNYQPWSTSATIENPEYNYFGYGPSTNMPSPDLTGSSANYDWGVYNPISNGGNQPNQWRTLTREEWTYVFNSRTTSSGIRYAMANVNSVNGVILLPDDWNTFYYTLSNTNSTDASFSSNTITATQWSTLEQHGAAFLPAAGVRNQLVANVGSCGTYWSASGGSSSSPHAYLVAFADEDLIDNICYGDCRSRGQSVRLVAARSSEYAIRKP